MFPCERVDVSFIDADSVKGRYLFRNSVDLAITPEQLFELFADAESWPRWVTPMTKVTWTMAVKPAGPARVAMLLVGPPLNLGLRRFLSNLRSYTDARAARQR